MTPSREIEIEQVTRELAVASELAVGSAADEERATQVLGQTKRLKNTLEEQRKFLVGPLNDHIRDINQRFKKLSEPVVAAEDRIKAAIVRYRESFAYRAMKDAEREIAVDAREAAAAGDIARLTDLAAQDAMIKEAAPSVIRTDTGRMATRTVVKWEVEDAALVPREFMAPNAVLIGQRVRGGLKEIPGVRIWEEQAVTVYGA